MKLGIFSPYLDTLTGGELYVLTAASCLSIEHDVFLFWDDPAILEKASEKFRIDLSKVTVVKNIFSKDISTAKRMLLSKKYDGILYLSDGSIPLVASKKLFLHFQFPVEWVENSFQTRLKMRKVAKVICNSYFTKQFIDKKFNVKSFVLYPPANLSEDKTFEKKNTILTVGRFSLSEDGSDFKKIGILAKAFKDFQKKRLKGWRFSIAMSVREDQKEEFEDFKKNLKSNFIDLHVNPSFKELCKLYGESKIYWHAAGFGEDLEKHPERAEHFGISTVEAMSYGSIPVVVNAGGQKEIIENTVNGYLWNTFDELVEITHKIARDAEHMQAVSGNSMQTSKKFSRERFCQEIGQLIR